MYCLRFLDNCRFKVERSVILKLFKKQDFFQAKLIYEFHVNICGNSFWTIFDDIKSMDNIVGKNYTVRLELFMRPMSICLVSGGVMEEFDTERISRTNGTQRHYSWT